MKKFVAFILCVVLCVGGLFGIKHFENAEKVTANAETVVENKNESVELPELTAAPAVEQIVEVTAEPTVEPTVVPTAEPTVEPTVAPTAEPTEESVVYVKTDEVTGKVYYETKSSEIVLEYVQEYVSAEEAVNAVEAKSYGAMMVVSHNDSRIVEGITAYDLIEDESSLEVVVNRNAGKLYVYDEAEEKFEKSSSTTKTFKGLGDKKAYSTWICNEHAAFKASTLVFEGYPESEGYRGYFKVADGFSAKVLKSVVLINTEGERYDWVLVSCDCVEKAPAKKSSSGGSKPSKPSKPSNPDPTKKPENNSRPSADPTQKPDPTKKPENNSRPSADPTKKPVENTGSGNVSNDVDPMPENNNRPSSEPKAEKKETSNKPSAEPKAEPKVEASSAKTESNSSRPSMKSSAESSGSGNVSADADPFA